MSVAGLQEGVAQDLKVNPAPAAGALTVSSTTATRSMERWTFPNAIPYSCDTFYYQLGDKLGIDRIAKYATEFDYGQKTGVDLPGGEQAGADALPRNGY